ncbi:hypothetical protein [Flavobacterium sp. UMI-01]|uniref:hypothetical protein n=1 Tax=Flavobacterium sp. UMI-01 TaxID=1441053 RepID=UPI001C7DEF96|nr:hypothetical protein [Flavobacterium sp. UMI-01]GIZ08412.1 hypothetical protein FUMI01_11390 [Flavobacterium sp. UMI-01]
MNHVNQASHCFFNFVKNATMKKRLPFKILIGSLFLILVFGSIYSCFKQRKDFGEFVFQEPTHDVNSTMDFNNLACLNESNKKIIDISTLIFNQNKKVPHLALVLKIKKNHENNNFLLRELTKRNMIVIPKPIYHLNLDKKALGNKDSTSYLVQILNQEIDIQLELLSTIKSTTFNPELKAFAEKTEKIVMQNSKDLKSNFKL